MRVVHSLQLRLWLSVGLLAAAAAAAQPRPDSIKAELNLAYAGTTNPRQALDLFVPAQRASMAPLPVVVFIHGGGWQNGNKAGGETWLRPLVASGLYAGISIGYRLAGESTWPAQIHDCHAAIRWIRANAARYGLDPDRIGVTGSSAGSTLALLLGCGSDVPELTGQIGPHRGESSRVACVVNFFARTNFLAQSESARAAPEQSHGLSTRLKLLFGGSLAEKADLARQASPIIHLSRDDAPILSFHGTADAVVPYVQVTEFDATARRAGVSHRLISMARLGHGFDNAEANRRARQFFDEHLRGIAGDLSTEPIVTPPRK